jgi:hypothetical protein
MRPTTIGGASTAGEDETIAPVTRNKHTSETIHLAIVIFIASLLCLRVVFAHRNPGVSCGLPIVATFLIIKESAFLLGHSAAKNADNGPDTSFNATID